MMDKRIYDLSQMERLTEILGRSSSGPRDLVSDYQEIVYGRKKKLTEDPSTPVTLRENP